MFLIPTYVLLIDLFVSALTFSISAVCFLISACLSRFVSAMNIVFLPSVYNTVFDCNLYLLMQVSFNTGHHGNSVLLDDVSSLTSNFNCTVDTQNYLSIIIRLLSKTKVWSSLSCLLILV